MLIHAFITSRLDYCNSLLLGVTDQQLKRLQSVQNAVARLVTGARRSDHITPVLQSLHWLPVRQRVHYKIAMLVHKCLNGRAPQYLIDECRLAGCRRSRTRSASRQMLEVTRCNTTFGDRSFAAAAPQVWNSLPDSVWYFTLCEDTLNFAKRLKSHLIISAAAPLTFNWCPLNELIIIIIISGAQIPFIGCRDSDYYTSAGFSISCRDSISGRVSTSGIAAKLRPPGTCDIRTMLEVISVRLTSPERATMDVRLPWQVHERGTVYRQLSAQPPHRLPPLKKNLNHFCLDCHSVCDNVYRSLTMFSALAAVCTV